MKGYQSKPPVAIETLARISFIIENFSLALETCNKNLTSITWLDESNRALSNIKSYLMNYKSNKDANSLSTNCLAQLDILLQASTKMNCVKSEKNLQNIITAENEYTRIMDLHNKQLHEKVASLEKEIGNLEKRIEDHNITSQKTYRIFSL